MAAAAQEQGLRPRHLSFMAAVQTLNEFRWLLLTAAAEARGDHVRGALGGHRQPRGGRPTGAL